MSRKRARSDAGGGRDAEVDDGSAAATGAGAGTSAGAGAGVGAGAVGAGAGAGGSAGRGRGGGRGAPVCKRGRRTPATTAEGFRIYEQEEVRELLQSPLVRDAHVLWKRNGEQWIVRERKKVEAKDAPSWRLGCGDYAVRVKTPAGLSKALVDRSGRFGGGIGDIGIWVRPPRCRNERFIGLITCTHGGAYHSSIGSDTRVQEVLKMLNFGTGHAFHYRGSCPVPMAPDEPPTYRSVTQFDDPRQPWSWTMCGHDSVADFVCQLRLLHRHGANEAKRMPGAAGRTAALLASPVARFCTSPLMDVRLVTMIARFVRVAPLVYP